MGGSLGTDSMLRDPLLKHFCFLLTSYLVEANPDWVSSVSSRCRAGSCSSRAQRQRACPYGAGGVAVIATQLTLSDRHHFNNTKQVNNTQPCGVYMAHH